MIVKQVSIEKILPLRRAILRPGYTLNQSKFDGDLENYTYHFAGFKNDKIIAVCTLIQQNNKNFSNKNQYQLRGMAVNENQQGKGFGEILFQESTKFLQQKNIDFLWFNARKKAVNFYLKQNCHILGKEFDIPTVGPHFLMFKNL